MERRIRLKKTPPPLEPELVVVAKCSHRECPMPRVDGQQVCNWHLAMEREPQLFEQENLMDLSACHWDILEVH